MILLVVGLAFLFLLLVGYMIVLGGRGLGEKRRAEGGSAYACGETLKEEELAVESDNFYLTFREALEPLYRFFEKIQDGDLTNYLAITILVLAFGSLLAVMTWA